MPAFAPDGTPERAAYGLAMTTRPGILVGIDGASQVDDALAVPAALAEGLGRCPVILVPRGARFVLAPQRGWTAQLP